MQINCDSIKTDKELFAEVRKLGITISKRDGEYRLNLRGGDEGTANYTNDRQDAYGTAVAMARSASHTRSALTQSEFEALTLAALDVLDNKTLTPAQRNIAEQIYELASKLEQGEE